MKEINLESNIIKKGYTFYLVLFSSVFALILNPLIGPAVFSAFGISFDDTIFIFIFSVVVSPLLILPSLFLSVKYYCFMKGNEWKINLIISITGLILYLIFWILLFTGYFTIGFN